MSGSRRTLINGHFAFTAPHELATQAGMEVLADGGHAVDAMIAAAAVIAVAYPHMNGLGGDGFWLVHEPGQRPWGVDASGAAGSACTPEWYAEHGFSSIPSRGPGAALTLAGAVSGWIQAKATAQETAQRAGIPGPDFAIERLLSPAITLAANGVTISDSLAAASRKVSSQLSDLPGFRDLYTSDGSPLVAGQTLKNGPLAELLSQLCQAGLDSFYRGSIGAELGSQLRGLGSPLGPHDLKAHHATVVSPLCAEIRFGEVFNLPEPTQGFVSILILALFDRLYEPSWTEADCIHALIECSKHAFTLRDSCLPVPDLANVDLRAELQQESIARHASEIDLTQVREWSRTSSAGDTVWMGARDKQGVMVSYIQSLFWEFGSGVVLPDLGLVWNNRGTSFNLSRGGQRSLEPGKKPFHTLNPALLMLKDGSRLIYGAMGGEGQPQTQAAMIARHLYLDRAPARSISDPRWLLGRTWGEVEGNLQIESDMDPHAVTALEKKGHKLDQVTPKNELMGHAGMIREQVDGSLIAASDPRSDGRGEISE
ncbi:MAG TPA: gamma-glutamyltransferase [Gammaproteobacteria bacterium]|nr:MAG: gamma-glutamyltransferase [OM182 bacterium]HAL42804.1 gamma-glutamyltransferase [Gammaproteobacteria bacterium]